MDIAKKDLGGNAEAEVVLYQPDSRLLATTLLSISAIFLTRVNWMKIQYVRNPYELPRWCSSKETYIRHVQPWKIW